MGDRHHEPPQAPPGRGAPLKGRRLLGPILAALVLLWAAGGAVLLRAAAARHDPWLWVGLLGSLAVAAAAVVAAWLARAPGEVRQGRRLRAPTDVTRTLTATLSLDDVFSRVVNAALGVIGSSVSRLWLVDDDGQHVSVRATAGATSSLQGLRRLRIGQGLAGTIVATGAPLTVRDVSADPRIQKPEQIKAAGLVSLAGLPLVAGERVLGALLIATREPHEFSAEELEFLASLAGHAAIAIDNARLYQRAEERAQKLSALSTLTALMASAPDSREVFHAIVRESTTLLRAKVSHVWVDDPAEGLLRIEGSFGLGLDPEHALMDTPSIGYGQGVVGRVFASRTPEYIADIQKDPRFINRRLATEAELHSYAGIPLVAGEQVVGVLSVLFGERREFTPEDRELMLLLGNHAAVAIDNARRFADGRTRQAYLSGLLEINRRIGAMAPPETLLSAIAEEAMKLLDVDNAGFRLVDGDDLVVAGLAGTASQTMLRPRIRIGESFSGRVVAEGRSMIADVESVADQTIPEHVAADRRLGYTTRLGVPLKVGDRTTGVFAFRGRRPFTTRDRELAEAFARQAAIAIEQARLHRETTQQAQRMGALVDLGRLLSETLDPDLVGQRIADSIRTLLITQTSALYRLEPVSGDLVALAVSGDAGPAFGLRVVFPRGTGVAGVALRERRVVFTPNLLTDSQITLTPESRLKIEQASYRAVLAIPLVVGDRVIGALAVGDLEGRAFDADEIRLAQAFADQAALALENARLYADATARRREAEELARVAGTFTESLDVAAVGQRIVESVIPLFRVKSAGLRLLRPDGSLEAIARSDRATTHSPPGDVQPAGVGVSGRTVATGRPVILSDVLADPDLLLADAIRRRVETSGDGAVLAVPLSVKGKTIGALSVADATGREFSESEIALLQAFADQAALALENARLYEAQAARAIRLRTLARLNHLVSSSLELDDVLGEIAGAAAELMQVRYVNLWVADEAARALTIRAFSDEALGGDLPDRTWPYGHGGAGWVALHRRLLYIPDVFADPRFSATEWAGSHGLTSFLGIPILVNDTLLGVLALIDRKPFAFGTDEQDLLDSFVGQAAVAIRNAQHYREAREYAERLRALEEVNRLVSSSLQMEEVLENIAAAVARFFDAPWASVWRLEPDQGVLRRAAGYGDSRLAAALPLARQLGEGAPGWVALHREPMFWADLEGDPGLGAPMLLALGLRYVTAFPIVIGDRVLGAIAVNRATPSAVTPETTSLLGSLAAQAAVALDNARLYSETSRRLEETRALLEVAEILNSTLDPNQLLRGVAIKIAQVCRVDRCAVELWDGDRVVPLIAEFADGLERPDFSTAFRARPPQAPGQVAAHARAIETRRPVVIDDTRDTDLLPRDWIETFGSTACMVVPLVRQDQVIGVMTLDYCDRPGRFDGSQEGLALAIAGQLALSLENTRLYAELQERLRETTTLLAVGQLLSRPGETDETMRRVAREVARAFAADHAVAYALDAERKGLVPLAGYRVPKFLLDRFRQNLVVPLRFHMLSLLREGRAVFSEDPLSDARFDRVALEGWPSHSLLFAPTVARGEVIGGIALVWWRPGRSFTPGEIRLIEGVAAQVGLAIENAELSRQTQIKLNETQTLLATSRALASTLDFNALARDFLRRVTQALHCDTVGLWMLDARGELLEPVAGYHVPPAYLPALRRLRLSVADHAFYAEAARTRHAIFSSNAEGELRIPPDLFAAAPQRGQLFVPIVLKERMIGGFAAVWWEDVRRVSADELALMEAIASQAGVALENVRLFQENRRQVDELAVLHDLSQAVTGQLDRGALLDAIQTKIGRVLDVGSMVVILRSAAGEEFEIALRMRDGVRDMHEPLRYPMRSAGPMSIGLVSVVFETGRSLRTDDYLAECERRGVAPVQGSTALKHWMGIPMTAGDEVLGVLVLRGGARPFTEAEERLMTNIAHLAALALRSAQLFEERTRAYGELAAAQDQLVRTEKLRALGEMASGVAHDFNNLLASILGRAQLALQRVQEPQIRQWLQVIERSALDGAQTVRRLQEFTRIRRDQPLVAVDLNQVIRDALEITQSRWREEPARHGVAFDVRTTLGPVPPIAGDSAELREALTNLILNAVDAMPDGGTLTLTTALVGDAIELTVQDTGVGMPEAVREKIFDPFFTTKGPQGTGLGLSMTYGILSRHGAQITVESEPGRGSTFRLTFPPTEAELAPAEDAGPQPDTPPMRCLVVDDEAVVGRMVGDVLETSGHQAVVVTEGEEAVARFRAESFDVVFTDLAMPGMSGWQVARAIKAIKPDVTVYLVTGFGVELSAEERRAHRVDAVLVKPLQIRDILAAVARAARKPGRPSPTEDS